MLILTRHLGEAIKVGELGEITVTILGVRGNQVRVGIEAPKEIPIHREEVHQRIQAKRERK